MFIVLMPWVIQLEQYIIDSEGIIPYFPQIAFQINTYDDIIK